MAPMVEMVGKVTQSRYDELVAESLEMVEEDTRCQFGLGDAALELEPLRGHGGHLPLDEGAQGVEESLRLFAEELGLSFYTVRTHRWDDETVAAQVATDFLRRPEVAFRAMRDAEARDNVNEAQFKQAGLDDDEFDEEYEEAFAEEGEPFDDPARIVHSWRKSMEFTDLIAVCQGFIAGAARLVPKLRGHEFTDTQTKVLENHLEKIRATADWIETAAATGQVDLDEQLAQLLRGQ